MTHCARVPLVLALAIFACGCASSQDPQPPSAGVAQTENEPAQTSTESTEPTGETDPTNSITVESLCVTVCEYTRRCDTDAEFAEVCRTGCQHFAGQSTACLQAVQDLFECIEPLGCGVFDMVDRPRNAPRSSSAATRSVKSDRAGGFMLICESRSLRFASPHL